MMPWQNTSPPPCEIPPGFTIILAEVEDLERICRLDWAALQHYRQRDFVAAAIEAECCWVAFFDEITVGYGIFNYQFQGYGVIHRLYVGPEFRRRGIGRALLEHFCEACSSPRLCITVPQQELALLELVRVKGFMLSGAMQELGNTGPALIYVKDLGTPTPSPPTRGLH